jgi:hypothetical protein
MPLVATTPYQREQVPPRDNDISRELVIARYIDETVNFHTSSRVKLLSRG